MCVCASHAPAAATFSRYPRTCPVRICVTFGITSEHARTVKLLEEAEEHPEDNGELAKLLLAVKAPARDASRLPGLLSEEEDEGQEQKQQGKPNQSENQSRSQNQVRSQKRKEKQ